MGYPRRKDGKCGKGYTFIYLQVTGNMDSGEFFGAAVTFILGGLVLLALASGGLGSGVVDLAKELIVIAFIIALIIAFAGQVST